MFDECIKVCLLLIDICLFLLKYDCFVKLFWKCNGLLIIVFLILIVLF